MEIMFFRDILPFLALILSYQQDTFVGNWASSRGARRRFSGHTRVLLLSRRAANRGRAFADSADGIGGAYAREFAAIGAALRKRYGSRALCHATDGRECSPTSRHRSRAAGTVRLAWGSCGTNTSRDERRGKPRGQGIAGSALRCRQSPALRGAILASRLAEIWRKPAQSRVKGQ